jgi:hypothetical protein
VSDTFNETELPDGRGWVQLADACHSEVWMMREVGSRSLTLAVLIEWISVECGRVSEFHAKAEMV